MGIGTGLPIGAFDLVGVADLLGVAKSLGALDITVSGLLLGCTLGEITSAGFNSA